MQQTNKLSIPQNPNPNSGKDIRQRMQEALRRFGYKQVDVSKETSKLTRYPSFNFKFMASRQNKRASS